MEHTESNTTFERFLFQRASENRSPLYGVLELLPLCTLDCDMCYVRLSRAEMEARGALRTTDEWLTLAEEMKDSGTLFLLLTGGEPLLFPDFKKLYLGLQEMGMILTINTNGTLIDEEWAKFFHEHKPRRINITLYGSNNDTYDRLCHLSDGFDRTLQGIRFLKKYGIDVKINGSLVKKNLEDRMDIIKLGEDLDIPVRIDTYMYPAVRERSRSFDRQARLDPDTAARARVEILHREMGEETFAQYVQQTLFLADNTPKGEHIPGHLTCRAGQCSFVINWQGEMRSCIVLDHPSIPVFDGKMNFKTAWQEIVQKTSSIETSPVCSECTLRAVCNVCAASAMAECGSYDAVPDYICQYTQSTVKYLRQFVDKNTPL